jgi:hypothetical protein
MSGGVDSSVVAGLLREQGHDVIGATLQLYDHGAATSRKGACCAGQDIHDARRVADTLDIPHYVLDRESRFRDAVVQDFADSYARGETPIPCIRCNQTVKFHDLVGLARDLGAEALATGHYVRRVEGAQGAELHRAADPARDQSYFLFATTREQLDFLRFPLGGLPKPAVRGVALDRDQAQLVVRRVPDRPGSAALVCRALADASISLDGIVQSERTHTSGDQRSRDISFTLRRDDRPGAERALAPVLAQWPGAWIEEGPAIARISAVGAGMACTAGTAARMFRALAAAGINIEMISTSPIKISCVVRADRVADAVRALHAAFDLGSADAAGETPHGAAR